MDTYAAELATLRARVEELERERDIELKQHARRECDKETARADEMTRSCLAEREGRQAAESRLSEATRLAVEALEPFAKHLDEMRFDIDHEGNQLPGEQAVGWVYVTNNDFRRARTALDRLNAMKGESDANQAD